MLKRPNPKQVLIWQKILTPLRKTVEDMGGILHVSAVFPDVRIEVWPPPELEEAQPEPDRYQKMLDIIDAPEISDEQQSITVVAAGENQCQRSPATLSRHDPPVEVPITSNSEILKLWRAQKLER